MNTTDVSLRWPPSHNSAGPALRVLIAEREPARLAQDSFALVQSGIDVTTSARRDDLHARLDRMAVEAFPGEPIDALVVEERTSCYDGVSLARAVREAGWNLSVFIVADAVSADLTTRAAEAGARVLDRSITPSSLVRVILGTLREAVDARPTFPAPYAVVP